MRWTGEAECETGKAFDVEQYDVIVFDEILLRCRRFKIYKYMARHPDKRFFATSNSPAKLVDTFWGICRDTSFLTKTQLSNIFDVFQKMKCSIKIGYSVMSGCFYIFNFSNFSCLFSLVNGNVVPIL
eukprot:Pompholyxophrys_punicea_v1_NODE_583_length_1649_cov_4.335006.p4 type:complete len:127 gc:universal NODE_583_length_1649_cov_4.335006:1155-775(-)